MSTIFVICSDSSNELEYSRYPSVSKIPSCENSFLGGVNEAFMTKNTLFDFPIA